MLNCINDECGAAECKMKGKWDQKKCGVNFWVWYMDERRETAQMDQSL